MTHPYLHALEWRYATKAFDPLKKVSAEDLEEIIEAFRLSASSLGLQPWKLFIVSNQAMKNEVMAQAWNQAQI